MCYCQKRKQVQGKRGRLSKAEQSIAILLCIRRNTEMVAWTLDNEVPYIKNTVTVWANSLVTVELAQWSELEKLLPTGCVYTCN